MKSNDTFYDVQMFQWKVILQCNNSRNYIFKMMMNQNRVINQYQWIYLTVYFIYSSSLSLYFHLNELLAKNVGFLQFRFRMQQMQIIIMYAVNPLTIPPPI